MLKLEDLLKKYKKHLLSVDKLTTKEGARSTPPLDRPTKTTPKTLERQRHAEE
jgi:hypothetical protein